MSYVDELLEGPIRGCLGGGRGGFRLTRGRSIFHFLESCRFGCGGLTPWF